MKLSRLRGYYYLGLASLYSGYPMLSWKEYKRNVNEISILSNTDLMKVMEDNEVEFNYSLDSSNNNVVPGGFLIDWEEGGFSLFVWDHSDKKFKKDYKKIAQQAIVVHEFVHLLQHLNGVDMDDVPKIEREAYNAQRSYMQYMGYIGLDEDTEEFLKERGYA